MSTSTTTTTTANTLPDAPIDRVNLSVDGVLWRVVHVEMEVDPMGNQTIRVVGSPSKGAALLGRADDDGKRVGVELAVANALAPLLDMIQELAARIDDLAHNLPDA